MKGRLKVVKDEVKRGEGRLMGGDGVRFPSPDQISA